MTRICLAGVRSKNRKPAEFENAISLGSEVSEQISQTFPSQTASLSKNQFPFSLQL
jgi:hypothetical protein